MIKKSNLNVFIASIFASVVIAASVQAAPMKCNRISTGGIICCFTDADTNQPNCEYHEPV